MGVHTQGWIHTACELLADAADEDKAKWLSETYDEHAAAWSFLSMIPKIDATDMGEK